ncbi:MAG: cytochrome c biogenesis protein CcdA [Candidatus Cryptobacteroides sp.]
MAKVAVLLLWSTAAFAQAPEATATWTVKSREVATGKYELTFNADIIDGWHIYSVSDPYNPVTVTFDESAGVTPEGELQPVTAPSELDGSEVFYESASFTQTVQADAGTTLKGTIGWSACNDMFCAAPEEFGFEVELPGEAGEGAVSIGPAEESGSDGTDSKGGIWSLIIEAILWGFAMLLTPCVFPMVPMTISFFMKQSSTPAEGRLKAFIYGLFIVLLYTLPICMIIGITWIVGGNSVTADIFNWLATHWLPNLLFFAVFIVFAASFFGAFEIELPSSLANKADSKSNAKGIGGIFFMALTLVLVSFSCTGPIVGTVLIKSTQGEFWTPMVTMLAFSVAFALPFTILAMFPSLLKKMKSGSWLNTVKVVLGFIEVALGFKFLSVADQTYHWGLLDREIYLAIWIVVFSLLGLYLLGKIRFANDSPVEHLSVTRLALAIGVFSFVVYMVPGMWGAPLKALSGYLPPIQTQDFVLSGYSRQGSSGIGSDAVVAGPSSNGSAAPAELPLGLGGYFSIEEGLKASKEQGKPVFVDITGHGCVNCREMEQRVWSDPEVLRILSNEYIIVALYTDDKARLPEQERITTPEGKVLKDLGRKNSYIARTRFGVNAQPNYVILDSEGNQLLPVRGYDLSIEGFIGFLNSGLEEFRK